MMTIGWPLRIIEAREVFFTYHGWIGKGKVVEIIGSHILIEREDGIKYYVDVAYDSADLAGKSLGW